MQDVMKLKRITKREAQKRFYEGNLPIILCPCNFYPAGPFSMGCTIFGKKYLECSWHKTKEEAWKTMYNN